MQSFQSFILRLAMVLAAGCTGTTEAPLSAPAPLPTAPAAPAAPAAPITKSGPQGPKPDAAVTRVTPEASRSVAVPAPASKAAAAPSSPTTVSPAPPIASKATPPASAPVPALKAAPHAAPQAAAPASLDLNSLKARLRDTKAIGVFTKLSLQNQVEDLLKKFRAQHQSGPKASVAALRQPYEMLLLKVLALVQDSDPPLAQTIASSREAIWNILADPDRFQAATA